MKNLPEVLWRAVLVIRKGVIRLQRLSVLRTRRFLSPLFFLSPPQRRMKWRYFDSLHSHGNLALICKYRCLIRCSPSLWFYQCNVYILHYVTSLAMATPPQSFFSLFIVNDSIPLIPSSLNWSTTPIPSSTLNGINILILNDPSYPSMTMCLVKDSRRTWSRRPCIACYLQRMYMILE